MPDSTNLTIFDSHAHYDDPGFDADRAALLSSLPAKGIVGVVNPGCTVGGSEAVIDLAAKYPFVWAAVGIHPEEAGHAREGDLAEIERLAARPKVVAIGEIGLDYHYEDEVPRAVQLPLFEGQLALANRLHLPVIVHDREAHGDTMELLRKYRPRGVVHCFSGSVQMALELADMGLYIGFTGVVTFKNARRAVEAAGALPFDRILIETDCPYMAPEPYRGTRCDSTMLPRVVERIALLRGVSPEEAARQTAENACRLYGIHAGSVLSQKI